MLPEAIVFHGKIGEIVHTTQPDGRIFEKFRRPPGTRLVIVSPEGLVLVTKEFRQETNTIDLRLPGGKVCDTLEAYRALRENGHDIVAAAKAAAIKEALQETGLIVRNLALITKASAGATVEWDLYYFLVRDFDNHPDGQDLELSEDIEVTWLKPAAIRQAISAGQMHEWRSVGVLLGKILPELEDIPSSR